MISEKVCRQRQLLRLVACIQVVDIMRVNVEKVLERDKKLTELDDRAGEISVCF